MEALYTCNDLINETTTFLNCSLSNELIVFDRENCSRNISRSMCDNYIVCDTTPDSFKFWTIILVIVFSLIGNICTIIILGKFKVHKVPDVLVIGLAVTDIFTTLIPIPMSAYAYAVGVNYTEGCILCDFFGTVALFSRFSSAQIVTIMSLERYFAVNRPFIYRKHATPKLIIGILLVSWLLALLLGVVPLMVESVDTITHDGFCLFDFTGPYSYPILVYSGIQFVIVFVCFLLVSIALCKVYRRRKRLKVQGEYNKSSRARLRDRNQVTFTRPNLTSRISDLGKSIKRAAPIIQEKFSLSVEAQFARMMFAVVVLFYLSWTTIVLIILIGRILSRSTDALEEALFWGIRFAIISTAINPFLYGILARQYRLAYVYVLRLWLSKCFTCVSPPLKDVFASGRNAGGEIQEPTKRGSQSRLHSVGSNSVLNHNHGVFTKTEDTMYRPAPSNITLPPALNKIQEELSLDINESSVAAEFSTHVPSAGELSSSVTIPYQARDHNDSSTVDLQVRGAASMHDLVDSGLVELGNCKNPQEGVRNPLAMITKVVDGEEVLVSPVGSDIESESTNVESPPLFSNPVYQLAAGISMKKGAELEAELNYRQTMLAAASSTEDITLISKKKKVAKTHSSDVPRIPTSTPPSHQLSKRATLPDNIGHVDMSDRKRLSGANRLSGKPDEFIPATDIDTGLPIMVSASRENLVGGGGVASVPLGNSPARYRIPPVKNLQSHAYSKSFDAAEPPQERSKVDQQRNSFNLEPRDMTEVMKLREQFESVSATPPLGQPRSDSHASTRMGRRNSPENSDSGHESMLETLDPTPNLSPVTT